MKSTWWIYIVECTDGTYYCGITTDLPRRIAEHNGQGAQTTGARYTRARRPVTLVWKKCARSRSAASKHEYHIKSLTRAQKLQLIRAKGTR